MLVSERVIVERRRGKKRKKKRGSYVRVRSGHRQCGECVVGENSLESVVAET